jgi:hypothetical protein
VSEMPRQLVAAQQAWVEMAAARREARFEDFIDLVQVGTSVEEACRRLRTTPVALMRQAYRHKRTDVIQYLGSATYRQRHRL